MLISLWECYLRFDYLQISHSLQRLSSHSVPCTGVSGVCSVFAGYLCQVVPEDAFPACNQVTSSEEMLVEELSNWTITCVNVGVSQILL